MIVLLINFIGEIFWFFIEKLINNKKKRRSIKISNAWSVIIIIIFCVLKVQISICYSKHNFVTLFAKPSLCYHAILHFILTSHHHHHRVPVLCTFVLSNPSNTDLNLVCFLFSFFATIFFSIFSVCNTKLIACLCNLT